MTELLAMNCPFCGQPHFVFVPIEELEAYENGALAQHAFKSLNSTQREQIISQICPECQKKFFK